MTLVGSWKRSPDREANADRVRLPKAGNRSPIAPTRYSMNIPRSRSRSSAVYQHTGTGLCCTKSTIADVLP
jgi:hypothetical protein